MGYLCIGLECQKLLCRGIDCPGKPMNTGVRQSGADTYPTKPALHLEVSPLAKLK